MMTQLHCDPIRQGLWFSIEIEKDEFLAFISADALSVHFKAERRKESLYAAYKANQKLIGEITRRKFLAGSPRPVKLDVKDF